MAEAGSAGGRAVMVRLATLISLAATPALLALAVAAWLQEQTLPPIICGALSGPSWLFAMSTMYAAMAAFHLAPWLRLAGRR